MIELNTEFLQLHTIVLYDEVDEQLVVWRDEQTRFFFGQTTEGGFREYGEKLIDGEWLKIFEDTFIDTQ